MTDRIEITLTASLPESGKYRILAAAEEAAQALAKALGEEHKMAFSVAVKAISPQSPRKAKVVPTPPTTSTLTEDVANELAAEALGGTEGTGAGEIATTDLPLQATAEPVHAPHGASDRRPRAASEHRAAAE